MLTDRYQRLLSRFISRHRRLLTIVSLFTSMVILYQLFSPFFRFAQKHGLNPTFFYDLILTGRPPLKAIDNRTNILLLGMGGANHEGVDLTDSLIIVSLSLDKHDVALISLPRDTWSPTLRDKVNSAYHYGEVKEKGGGLILAKSIAEEITGLAIHYGVVINFEAFTKIIDLLGGIEVNVEQGFTDPKFPIPGKENDDCDGDPVLACRYQIVTFATGLEQLNGERTLQFVRSRNAEGNQGDDFARGKRQQQVLLAIKDKLMKQRLFLYPRKVKELTTILSYSVETDLTTAEIFFLAKLGYGIDQASIRQIPLVTSGEDREIKGFLTNPPLWQYDGRWVLIPPDEDYSKIHQYLSCQLTTPACPITLP